MTDKIIINKANNGNTFPENMKPNVKCAATRELNAGKRSFINSTDSKNASMTVKKVSANSCLCIY